MPRSRKTSSKKASTRKAKTFKTLAKEIKADAQKIENNETGARASTKTRGRKRKNGVHGKKRHKKPYRPGPKHFVKFIRGMGRFYNISTTRLCKLSLATDMDNVIQYIVKNSGLDLPGQRTRFSGESFQRFLHYHRHLFPQSVVNSTVESPRDFHSKTSNVEIEQNHKMRHVLKNKNGTPMLRKGSKKEIHYFTMKLSTVKNHFKAYFGRKIGFTKDGLVLVSLFLMNLFTFILGSLRHENKRVTAKRVNHELLRSHSMFATQVLHLSPVAMHLRAMGLEINHNNLLESIAEHEGKRKRRTYKRKSTKTKAVPKRRKSTKKPKGKQVKKWVKKVKADVKQLEKMESKATVAQQILPAIVLR